MISEHYELEKKYNHISLETEHLFLIDMKEGYTVIIKKSETDNQSNFCLGIEIFPYF
jgi:hypothetical protein